MPNGTLVIPRALIALAYLGKLQILDRMFKEWWVPPAVLCECSVKDKVFSTLFNSLLPHHLKHPHDSKLVDVLSLQIGRGESESIVLAGELDIRLVLIDDKKGRRFALLHDLEPIGTIGILLSAKKRGLLTRIRPELEKLIESGIHIHPALINEALKLSGEL